jgi:hypothetical protein
MKPYNARVEGSGKGGFAVVGFKLFAILTQLLKYLSVFQLSKAPSPRILWLPRFISEALFPAKFTLLQLPHFIMLPTSRA